MSADKPPDNKPDPPTPPKVEGRVVPTRPDNAGAKQQADAAPDVNRPVHAKLADMSGQVRAAAGHAKDSLSIAAGHAKDTARNVVDQAQMGGRLAVGSAVEAGRTVANGAKAAADKLDKPIHALAAAAVGVVAMHGSLDKVPPASHDALVEHHEVRERLDKAETTHSTDSEAVSGPPDWADRR